MAVMIRAVERIESTRTRAKRWAADPQREKDRTPED